MRVLAISTDPVFSLKAFREKEGFDFSLLSDFWPHGAVAQAYGVFNEKAGMALRGTFLIDAEGRSPSPRSTSPATPASSRAGRTPSASSPPDGPPPRPGCLGPWAQPGA